MILKFRYRLIPALIIALIVTATASQCLADDAVLRFVAEDKNNPGNFSLVIDKADKIAGMKLSISYDKDLLVYKEASKSKATSSFLHVVNDKKPGQLIIVMASAKGVSGDNLPLVHLVFQKLESDIKREHSVKVTQLQLMTESLQEIKANHPEYIF